MKLDLMNFLLKLQEMNSFHSLYITQKQDYLHSIHFHSFLFVYFKTSN